jgi:hypothetical protein
VPLANLFAPTDEPTSARLAQALMALKNESEMVRN